jgi:hypothetical protein
MAKERVQRLVVGLVVILLVASALGYLLVPSAMLDIVGIQTNPQVTFLARALAAALLAPSPGAWAARRRDGTPAQRSVLIGLAAYMFASSLVDLYGFLNQVVGIASVPSIALGVLLGAVLVWLIPVRNGLRPLATLLALRRTRRGLPIDGRTPHGAPWQAAAGSSRSGGIRCSLSGLAARVDSDDARRRSGRGVSVRLGGTAVADRRPRTPRGPLSHRRGSVGQR